LRRALHLPTARRYLEICEEHPPSKGAAVVRGHLFKLLHHGLRTHTHLRDELLVAPSLKEMSDVVGKLDGAGWDMPNFHAGVEQGSGASGGRVQRLELSWYRRHRTAVADNAVTEAPAAPATREEMEAAALQKRLNKKHLKRQRYSRKRESSRSERKEGRLEGVQGAASKAAEAH
jgi:hypothetical protein